MIPARSTGLLRRLLNWSTFQTRPVPFCATIRVGHAEFRLERRLNRFHIGAAAEMPLKPRLAAGFSEKAAPQPRNWAERLHSKQQKEYTASKKPDYQSAFQKWNELAPSSAWIISPRGANPITLEVVANCFLADTLKASHQVIGYGSRLMAGAIRENIAPRYMPEQIVTHAGEIPTILFSIPLPKA